MDRTLVILGLAAFVIVASALIRVIVRRRHAISRFELSDLGDGDARRQVVVFTSPYCHGCRQWIDELERLEAPTHVIDISERPDLAARYRINHTPRVAVASSRSGNVLREFDHYSPRHHDLDAVEKLLDVR